ncbi:MAG TPA: hypothetical protein VFZ65_18070 [Planctomycetota bacterium]|nr:hypothetical protein [Planctomycetota bacterium]
MSHRSVAILRRPQLWVCVLSSALAAQDAVSRAIDELQFTEKQEHAIDVLLANGKASVAPLQALLARVATNDEPNTDQVAQALIVLGRLGKLSLDALPEVTRVYAFSRRVEIRNQAIWAMMVLAPKTGDPRLCAEVRDALRKDYTKELDAVLWSTAWFRLNLGPEPAEAQLLAQFAEGGYGCRAVANAVVDQPALGNELRQVLRDALAVAVARPELPWLHRTEHDWVAADLAAALWRHGARDADTARGLLRHWDADLRQLALVALSGAASLAPMERLDVVMSLWDGTRRVHEQALAALQSYGENGIVALRALRAFEAFHRADPTAVLYRRAADRIVAEVAAASDSARELVRAIDRAVSGEPFDAAGPPLDATGVRLLTEAVIGCRGADDGSLAALSKLASGRRALAARNADALRVACFSTLAVDDPNLWWKAAEALTVLGPAVVPFGCDVESVLLESCAGAGLPLDVFPVEAVLYAGEHRRDDEVLAALSSDRWHVVLRAAVETTVRHANDPHTVAVLTKLLRSPFDVVRCTTGPEFASAGRGRCGAFTQPNVAAVHVAAALALFAAGGTPWTDENVAAEIADQWSIEVGSVAQFLGDARDANRLAELAREVEQKAWAKAKFSRFP